MLSLQSGLIPVGIGLMRIDIGRYFNLCRYQLQATTVENAADSQLVPLESGTLRRNSGPNHMYNLDEIIKKEYIE